MTESEWLACEEPVVMLEFLNGNASHRKSQLYISAECRLMWHLLYHPSCRTAVEVAERFADGEATEEELREAGYYAESPTFGFDFNDTWRQWPDSDEVPERIQRLVQLGILSATDFSLVDTPVARATQHRLQYAIRLAELSAGSRSSECLKYALTIPYANSRYLAGCPLVRDIFGNPFRPAALDPAWRTDTVLALARGIYEERAFDRMPILADALEDAGCDSDDILAHCRGPGPHVRGCWVVDLVLGKS